MIRTVLLLIIAITILVGLGSLAMAKQNGAHDKQANASQKGTFSVLGSEVDGRPLIAIIDMGLRNSPDRQHLPFFLSLSTPLISPTSDGLPTKNDADSLNTWEDAMEARLRPIGKFVFVGRVTWNGNRELLYYVNDPQPAVEVLKKLSDAHSTRPFAFRCNRDEKWDKANFWFNHK